MQTTTGSPSSLSRKHPHLLGYGAAVLLTVVALLLTLLLEPLLSKTPSPLFFAAVALSAAFSGLGPALLATGLSALALDFLLLEPEGQLTATTDSALHMGGFVLVAMLISALDERRRRAETRFALAAGRLQVLAEASRAFAKAVPDWQATVETVARRTAETIGDCCVLSLASEDRRWLVPVAWHHPDPKAHALMGQLYTNVRHGLAEGPSGQVLQTGQPLLLPKVAPADVTAVTKPEYAGYLERFPIHSVLIVPLRHEGRILGTLTLTRNTPDQPYTPADEILLQDLADRAALSINNAQINAHYRGLFEEVAEGIVVVDADRRFLDVNPAAARLLGYSREELCRLRVDDIVAADPAEISGEWNRFLGESLWRGEFTLRRKDGVPVPVDVTATMVKLPTGAVHLAAWRDVSARQELERLRESFVASVSHDLRTPLTAIKAGLGMLEASGADQLPDEQRQLLANARRNAERLGMLVDDLLAHNQLQAGTLHLDVEPLDLRGVVANATTAIHPLIRQKGQRLELHLPNPLSVTGDKHRLEQVIVNVLGNAHQHTPAGTRIAVSGTVSDGEVCLTVHDNGPGIPSTELEAIFQRFHRLSTSNGGSGLGLAIARSLVDLHGGRLWAESEPRRGTAFHMALPLATVGGRVENGRPTVSRPNDPPAETA